MNVAYHHRTQFTGIERVHIMGMVTGLRSIGHCVAIVGPPGTNREKGVGASVVRYRFGLTALWRLISDHAPEIVFEFFEILYNLNSFIRLILYLRTHKVDLIYERYSLFLFSGVLVARMRKLPIVLEINDSALIDRTRPLRGKKVAIWFEKRILKSADLLITISQRFKRKILVHHIDDQKILVLPNAIDPDVLDPRKHREQNVKRKYHLDGRFIIGFVGLFVPWHGLLFLLDVFEKLAAQYGFLHLLLVGDGPERTVVESRVRERHLTEKVTMTGYVSHERVPEFMKTFDAAVMPDSNEHGSPMKIFEYMGMAKPVVAPSYAPIREVLQDGKNALLFEPNDAGGLHRALEMLIKDEGLRSRLGESARQDVLAGHTWHHNAMRLQRVLDGITQNH